MTIYGCDFLENSVTSNDKEIEGETGITEEESDKASSEILSVANLVNTTLNSRQDNTLISSEADGDVTLTNGKTTFFDNCNIVFVFSRLL
jgi:hypothetical protein